MGVTRNRPVVQVGADMMLIPVSTFDRSLGGEFGRGHGQEDEEDTTLVPPAERMDLDKKIKEGLKALRDRDIKASTSNGGDADEEWEALGQPDDPSVLIAIIPHFRLPIPKDSTKCKVSQFRHDVLSFSQAPQSHISIDQAI